MNSEPIKHAADATAVTSALAAFFGYLPDVAALLSVIWLAIRIFETRTVQRMFGRCPRTRREDQ